MQVSIETTSGLERKVTVAVPSQSFEEQIEKRLRDAAREMRLPGFRPGKVPVKVVRRRFGSSLRREVAAELVESSFHDALSQENLNPAGQPTIDLVNIEADADLEFVATLEVLPQVRLADFETLRIGHPEVLIEPADLDAMVESLREQKVEWNAVERPAAARDRVKVDYSVKVDGKDVDGRPRENVQFIVGANDAFKELDAAVVGMTLNETRTFPAAIAEQHPDAELRGREALGEVTLKAVDEPTLPELDDAFFDEFEVVQPEDGGSRLDLFRDDVRQRMRIELHAATRRATRREVMQALDRLHDFELPKALLAAEQKVDRERWPKGLDMPDEARDALARAAEQRVRTQLVVGEIIKRESMKADDDRIEERIEEIVSGYQNPDEMRNWIWSEDEQIDRIEAAVLEDQVVDYVLSQAQVVPVSMSYQDLVSGEPMPELPEPAPVEASPERDDSGEEAATGAAVVDQPAAAEQPPAGGQPAVADATDGTSPADSAAPVELLEPAGEAVAEDATPEPATEPDEQGGERGGLLRRLRLFGRKRT